MKAFHGDPEVKEKYLARVRHHQKADNLIRGQGWVKSQGKGCAVGCTLEAYDHSRYPIELGIPQWLAHVEDDLFEGMSEEKSRTWPEKFLQAIPIGTDLEQVKAPFLIMVLKSTLDTFDHSKYPNVKKAVHDSIALWTRKDIGSDDWKTAAKAAAGARAVAAAAAEAGRAAWAVAAPEPAESAACAAWAAAAPAPAESAACAAWAAWAGWAAAAARVRARARARAAAWAGWAAAWAGCAAAAAAARARLGRYDYFADELLEMLAKAK